MLNRQFNNLFREKVIVLDGASGTLLQKRGMPVGICPELWSVENPSFISDVQREYKAAGADAVLTFTLGGSRLKLDEYGVGDRTYEINKRAAQITRSAVGPDYHVGGDIGPMGQFVNPFGEMPFETAVDIFKEQVRGLLEGGVDFFLIETMIDIQEARAALLAVKEMCDLPVFVSMTFARDGHSLMGTDPITALITLQSLGADVVGCNCSTGPQAMIPIIEQMKRYARVPLLAKPNAGLPRLINCETVFDMAPPEFGSFIPPLIEAGVDLIGGCCGTSPEYIKLVASQVSHMTPKREQPKMFSAVTSARKTVFIGDGRPLVIIGERINPTGKKRLQETLMEGDMKEVKLLATEQVENQADILDINVGMAGIDERSTILKVIECLIATVDVPLCFDSSDPEVIESALRVYPGRALINSISGEQNKMNRLLPIAAKYGAMFILLPLDEHTVPPEAANRCEIVNRVFQAAKREGFTSNDIIVDGLVMTVSSDPQAARETLKLVEWSTKEIGCNTIVGLSNVSFGLPQREWINAAFLAMAMDRGLTMSIMNPTGHTLMNIKMASDVLNVTDKSGTNYLRYFVDTSAILPAKPDIPQSPEKRISDAVIRGDREHIFELLDTALATGLLPKDLLNECLIPAITEVGELYDRKQYFLPQLITSAETMKLAFEYLEPLMASNDDIEKDNRTKIVLASVRGDIHDIGKNIVAIMLRNFGYDVLDLGKNVSAHEIIDRAREVGAAVIGLSALMTTTMMEMKNVIELARSEGLACKFMIGGAVITEQFANAIGADGYSPDAYSAVKLVNKLVAAD